MIGAVAAVLALLVVGLPRLIVSDGGAETVARAFLQSLVDGDVEAIRPALAAAPDASAALLDAGVTGTETLDAPRSEVAGYELLTVERVGSTATATARLWVAGDRETVTLHLTAEAGGPFSGPRWQVTPVELPVLAFDVPLGYQELEINGRIFPVEELHLTGHPFSRRIAVQMLPGQYAMTLPGPQPWTQSPTVTATVPAVFGRWRKPFDGLQPELTEAAHAEITAQVGAAVEDCARTGSTQEWSCPLTPGDGVTWTLDGPPEVMVNGGAGPVWYLSVEAAATRTADDGEGGTTEESGRHSLNGIAVVDTAGTLSVQLTSSQSVSYTFCTEPGSEDFDGRVRIVDAVTASGTDPCG